MGNSSPNGFGSSTTAEEVSKESNLSGKTIVITGANTGKLSFSESRTRKRNYKANQI
jgi:hypothetical protein